MTAMVIGGGPAGAALAIQLARVGRDVVLVERESGPADKVCGEFISREAGMYLAKAGLDLAALGAVPIEMLRLYVGERVATIALPFAASSLSRRVLDEALLHRAAASGVMVRRGAKVNVLARCGSGWTARLDDGSDISGAAAFLATGKHDLRSHRRRAGLQNDLVAFKMHWRLAPAQAARLTRHVELHLFAGGYAGLQPVENGLANLCLLVRRRRLAALGQRWEPLLAAIRVDSPGLDERLADARPCWARPRALSAIPYGLVQRRGEGPWRLGDQAAVIPSFSGDGMSIAMHSAQLAATMYLEGRSVDAYQRRLARDVSAQMMLASALSRTMVHPVGQAAVGLALRLWPGLMSTVAFRTRVPESALDRANAWDRS